MSEPIPEAIPTSADPRTKRPVKRLRGANTAVASQANEIENLMWDPDRPVDIPQLSAETKPKLAPPPEFVANVQGSSAGAGSGEFHVYKASRRRENERLRAMDEEAQKEEDDDKWIREREEKRLRDEEKTAKKRAGRNKRKAKKEGTPVVEEEANTNGSGKAKKPLQIPKRVDGQDGEEQKAEESKDAASEKENGIVIHDED